MNLVDCHITEITSKPYLKYSMWWVDFKYISWGREAKSEKGYKTKEEAEKLKVNDIIQQ